MTSHVFTWEGFKPEPTAVGERREVAHQSTATLELFQSHISTLLPALTTHEPHRHAQEELVLIKEGTLDVHINGKVERAGPGALLFFAANDWHNVSNVGEVAATYLVFNLVTPATREAPEKGAAWTAAPDQLRSGVYRPMVEAVAGDAPAREMLFDAPAVTLDRLSAEILTLDPGAVAFADRRVAEEFFVVVTEGRVEFALGEATALAGPGSVAFVASADAHGIRNVDQAEAARIYIVSWRTPRTGGPEGG